jgi:hypothetical protein
LRLICERKEKPLKIHFGAVVSIIARVLLTQIGNCPIDE